MKGIINRLRNSSKQSKPKKKQKKETKAAGTPSGGRSAASGPSTPAPPSGSNAPNADEPSPFPKRTLADLLDDDNPSLREAGAEEKKSLFVHKMGLCTVIFDFMGPVTEEEAQGIEKKRILLNELVEHISTQEWFSEEALLHLLNMIKCNLFRGLPGNPASDKPEGQGGEDEDSFQDPSWPHLHLIYEVLLRFLLSPNANKKIMQKHLHGVFLNTLIEMFESEDMRERDYLKTILHRVYGRFMPLRAPIRKSICNVCYRYIYDKKTSNGIAEFLDIFSSIIHGFALPIKNEHQEFLRNVLIPLHKTADLELFHQHLAECVIQFIYKDYRMGPIVIGGLLKFWPVMCPPKEVLFLDELQDAIGEMMNANDFEMEYLSPLITPIFVQIARCIESLNYTVGERALTLWNSDFIRWLCAELRDVIFPILAPSLLRNIEGHWSENVRSLSDDVRDVFKDIDPLLWQERETAYKDQQKKVQETAERRKTNRSRNYALLKQLASKRKAELNLPADSPDEEKGDPLPPKEEEKAEESKKPPSNADKSPLSLDPGPAEAAAKKDGPVDPKTLGPSSTTAASRPPASATDTPDPAASQTAPDGKRPAESAERGSDRRVQRTVTRKTQSPATPEMYL